MKPALLDLIVCPMDRSNLELIEWESESVQLSDEHLQIANKMGIDPNKLNREILNGVLVNRGKRVFYPIYNGVPRLLVFKTELAEHFERQYKTELNRDCPDCAMADEPSASGEADVLRSFSAEWTDYGWDGETYWNLSPEDMFKSMHFMLDLDNRPVKHKKVLELGIGIGGIADYVSRSQECELVGVDLGYSVDAAYAHFGTNPFFHVVQASAFALPFKDESFDFVYSQGVIHHTFSTKTAFDGLSRLPKRMGRLYIWVYSQYDESRNFKRRLLMALENVLRPMIWPLPNWLQNICLVPLIPLYIVHQRVAAHYDKNVGVINYGIRQAIHAARDRFTPRYIHRHANEEVQEWFEDAGYTDLQYSSKRDAPAYIPQSFTACTGVDGFRSSLAGESERRVD